MSKSSKEAQLLLNFDLVLTFVKGINQDSPLDQIKNVYTKALAGAKNFLAEQPGKALKILKILHEKSYQVIVKLEVLDPNPEVDAKLKLLNEYIIQFEEQIRQITNIPANQSIYQRNFMEEAKKSFHYHSDKADIKQSVQVLKPIYKQLAQEKISFFGITDMTNIISDYLGNQVQVAQISDPQEIRKIVPARGHVSVAVFGKGDIKDPYSRSNQDYGAGVKTLIEKLSSQAFAWGSNFTVATRVGAFSIRYFADNFNERNELTPRCHQIKLIVCNVHSEASFEWAQSVLVNKDNLSQFNSGDRIILVANNIDQERYPLVEPARIDALAKVHGVDYCEVSAPNGQNISQLQAIIMKNSRQLFPLKKPEAQQPKEEVVESKGGCSIM